MRVFWALMAALILAGGAVLFMRERPATAGAPRVAETAARPAPVVQTSPVPTTPPATTDEEKKDTAETPAPQVKEAAVVEEPQAEDIAVEAAAKPAIAEDAQVALGTGETPVPPPVQPEEAESPEPVEVAVAETEVAPEEEAVVGTGETPPPPEAPAPAVAVTTREDLTPREAPAKQAAPAEGEVRPDAVERREDGAYLIGGTHVVTGEGTVEKPFEVSWEMLVSASRVYRPKQGKLELPEWAALLNGKQVRITGFVAFPFVADAAGECLLMLNQWDGCCIGVPPTPYDAVEVKLGVPLDLTRQAINYGSIRGTFSVDPYLVNNFLVGLYVMDDGVVEATAARDAQGY